VSVREWVRSPFAHSEPAYRFLPVGGRNRAGEGLGPVLASLHSFQGLTIISKTPYGMRRGADPFDWCSEHGLRPRTHPGSREGWSRARQDPVALVLGRYRGARSVVELRGLRVQMWSRGLVRRTVCSRTAFAICRIQVPAPEVAEGEGNAGPRNGLHGN